MHQRLDIRAVPSADQRISMSGVMIAFFILSLPMTMFQLGAFGSAQRLITFVICAVALFLLYQTRAVLNLSGGAVFWVAYAAWIFLSVIWTARIGSQLTVALGMVLLIGALVLMAMLPVTESDLRIIRFSWMLLAVFAAVLFLVFGEQAEFGNRTHLVLPSGGSDPNEFSAYFLMPLAYFVEAALEKSGPIRIAALAATLGAFYIVLMTGSRAGAIASFVVICAVALRFAGQGFGKFLLVTILGFIGIFAAGRLLLPLVPEEVRERLSIDALLEDSGSARDEIWRTGIELMEQSDWRLLLGYGPNGAPFDSRIMHNHFVQALVDGGLIGLALFLLVIISALIVSFRNKAVFAATLGVAVMFLTLTAYSNFRPAWAVLFMALLVARRAKSRDDAKHPAGELWRNHHAKRAV